MSRVLFAAIVICATPAFADVRYFSELSDVPMPEGFAEVETAIGFGADQGRLVMAEAEGAAAPDSARSFYLESLPALGWSFSPSEPGALVFLRGRERLSLTVTAEHGVTRLSARLVVRPASMNAD